MNELIVFSNCVGEEKVGKKNKFLIKKKFVTLSSRKCPNVSHMTNTNY